MLNTTKSADNQSAENFQPPAKKEGFAMLKQGKKSVTLTVKMSYEEYHEFKLAVWYVSMDKIGRVVTPRGNDAMYQLMEFIVPAMEDEVKAAIKAGK